MTVTYHKMPQTEGIEQIGTIWKFYTDANIADPFETTDIRNPKDIYSLTNNIAIPVNETYYVTATRITRLLNEDGNPETDENGDEIIQYIEPGKRSPITNEEGLQSVNVYLTPLPEQPMLKHKVLVDGSIEVTSSTILPDILTLDLVYWTVYGDGKLLWSKEQNDETAAELIVPFADISEHNEVTVTVVHMSEGVASPIAKYIIDTYVKIVPVTERSSVSSLSDYYFTFTSPISNISDLISRVELVDMIDDNVITTLYPSVNNTLTIEAKYLKENKNYLLLFIMHGPTTTEGNNEIEKVTFRTMEITSARFIDKEHTYDNRFIIETDTSLIELNDCQLEKLPDGRFLTVQVNDDLTTTLKWNTMEKGRLKLVTPIDTDKKISNSGHRTLNLLNGTFLLAGTDAETGRYNISVCHDNFLGQAINFEAVLELPDNVTLNLASMTFDPITSYVYYSTNIGLHRFKVTKNMITITVEDLRARPDDIIDGTIFIAVDDNILVLGGGSDSSYFYNPHQDRYEFAAVVPTEFSLTKLPMVLINGNVMFSPYNVENNNKTLIYETRRRRFIIVETDMFISNITGTLKSNGVTIVTNGENLAGYFI